MQNFSTGSAASREDKLLARELSVVALDTLALQRAADDLYRAVFGYVDSSYSLSPRLLRSLLLNGGSALGALNSSGELIGVSYGYTGADAGGIYHYSQATAVAGHAQGIGVGRLLKYAQAEVARMTGATSMRWAFDPAITRNGHFNLDTLGARGRWFYPDFYDEPESDRMVVDWMIDGEDPITDAVRSDRDKVLHEADAQFAAGNLSASGISGEYRWLLVPSQLPRAAETRLAAREAVAAGCIAAIAAGRSAVACRTSTTVPHAAVYLFGEETAYESY